MEPTRAAYDELYVYTMGRPGFILQHVVDAFAVQNANPEGPLISVVFGLVGLYLHIEKQFFRPPSARGPQEARAHRTAVAHDLFSRRSWPDDSPRRGGGTGRARAGQGNSRLV